MPGNSRQKEMEAGTPSEDLSTSRPVRVYADGQ